jgi:hypothetical protein
MEAAMFASLPAAATDFMDWPWSQIEPYYHDLHSRPLTAENVAAWLSDWSRLIKLLRFDYTPGDCELFRTHRYLTRARFTTTICESERADRCFFV